MSFKSPFMVYQEFLSPKLCRQLLQNLHINSPDTDEEGKAIKMIRYHEDSQNIILPKFKEILPEIESHYDISYKGLEKMEFQFYPEGTNKPGEEAHCESSQYLRKKWVKVHDRDLTAVLWLKDYQDNPPLDTEIETYGGKLEFPAYDFSLVPQMGTLVIYPSGPHFITAMSPVMVGDLYQVRMHLAAEPGWFYQPENFQGEYTEWFKEYA